jgi:hypothetical protein
MTTSKAIGGLVGLGVGLYLADTVFRATQGKKRRGIFRPLKFRIPRI